MLDPIDISIGAPQGSPISPVLSIIYMAELLHIVEGWNDSRMYMYIDDGNILSTGPSYNLVSRSLRSQYEECLNWLLKAGLSIESKKMKVIFYSPKIGRAHV